MTRHLHHVRQAPRRALPPRADRPRAWLQRSTRWLAVGLGVASVCACGGPTVEVPPTFAVVHTAPHHGAIEVSREVLPYIAFSAAVSHAADDAISLREMTANGPVEVQVAYFLDDEQLSVRLVPDTRLAPRAEYELFVDASLVAENGAQLGADWRSSFLTLDEED